MVSPGRAEDNVGEAAIYGRHNAQKMLANGFTTLRDVGGGWGIDLAVRDAINEGVYSGPQIFAAGPALSITGGHGDTNDMPDFVTEETTIESAVTLCRYPYRLPRSGAPEHVKRHTDLVKILATGGACSATATCGTFRR